MDKNVYKIECSTNVSGSRKYVYVSDKMLDKMMGFAIEQKIATKTRCAEILAETAYSSTVPDNVEIYSRFIEMVSADVVDPYYDAYNMLVRLFKG